MFRSNKVYKIFLECFKVKTKLKIGIQGLKIQTPTFLALFGDQNLNQQIACHLTMQTTHCLFYFLKGKKSIGRCVFHSLKKEHQTCKPSLPCVPELLSICLVAITTFPSPIALPFLYCSLIILEFFLILIKIYYKYKLLNSYSIKYHYNFPLFLNKIIAFMVILIIIQVNIIYEPKIQFFLKYIINIQ